MPRAWTDVAALLRARYDQCRQTGMTQRALADVLGVTHSHVSLLLAGKRSPSWEVFVKLCEVLNLSPADLIEDGATAARRPVRL